MYLTLKEVAKEAGCTQENLQYHIRRGKIPVQRTKAGHVMVEAQFMPMIKTLVQKGQK